MARRRDPFLRVGDFAVDGSSVFACDREIPVMVELDVSTMTPLRVVSWPISEAHRGQPVVTGIRCHGGDVWISSPVAGGLVRIASGATDAEVLSLDAIPGPIEVLGGDLLVIADPNWQHAPHREMPAVESPRPVEWRDAPIEETSGRLYRWKGEAGSGWADSAANDQNDGDVDDARCDKNSGWFVWTVGDQDDGDLDHALDDEGDGAAEDEDEDDEADDDDGDFAFDVARPVWRMRNGVAERIDLGGDVHGTVSLPSGEVVADIRRADHPLVKIRRGYGVSFGYPSAVAVIATDGSSRVIRECEDGAGLLTDGSRLFVTIGGRCNDSETLEMDTSGEVVRALGGFGGAFAIVNDVAVSTDYEWDPSRHRGVDRVCVVSLQDASRRLLDVTIDRRDASDSRRVRNGNLLWLTAEEGRSIVRIDPASGDVEVFQPAVDLSTSIPLVEPRAGIDPAVFASERLAGLREGLNGVWTSADGGTTPFIDGATFISFRLAGSFPETQIEVEFESTDRPGMRFGTRFDLFDALGNEDELEYATIHMMETIEASPGLPRADVAVADGSGVVWVDAN